MCFFTITSKDKDKITSVIYFISLIFFQEVENASPKRDIDARVGKKPDRVPERKLKLHVMNDCWNTT